MVLIRTDKGHTYSDVLIRHMKILAIDQLANERREKLTAAKAVTLRLVTEQAQKILFRGRCGQPFAYSAAGRRR